MSDCDLTPVLGSHDAMVRPPVAARRSNADALPPVPNFFIVGAAKCGTTSLFDAVSCHPDVFCCPVKEPNYFAFDYNANQALVAQARKWGTLIDRPSRASLLVPPRVGLTTDYFVYRQLFGAWFGQTALGEASTSYLPSSVAAGAIATCNPHARIIILLRDPVRRAYSDYLMQRQMGGAPGSFREAVDGELDAIVRGRLVHRGILRSSFYATAIRRYLDQFPRSQVHILLFDDLVRHPQTVLTSVFHHIGVDPVAGADIRLAWENKSRVPRFGRLNQALLKSGKKDYLLRAMPTSWRRWLRRWYYEARDPVPVPATEQTRLHSLFSEDIAETASLIGRDLTHWTARD